MPHKRKIATGKSWSHRLSAEPDQVTAELLASLDMDAELWQYDIAGSLAHAQMLRSVGLIDAAELAEIRDGLLSIEADIQAGKLAMPVELEDIHMVIEAALIRRTGDAGRKLHTGRSRNDQVATDLRLWARDAADGLSAAIAAFQKALVGMAERAGDLVIPAYTHLQRAQPVLAAHAVLAYVEMLQRDADRLADCRRRLNVCPLGSGAVAGTSLPLDRQATRAALGFSAASRNSIDATADRDFLAELCFCCSLLAVHLSRWAEDWILYSTTEFAMLELADAYCTSSSMMPQKKNADTLELIRGKSATAIANLTGMLTLLKGLPLAYNRDLQDDKRFALPTVAAMGQALSVAAGIAATARFRPDRVAERIDQGFLDATSLAEYFTARGMPFRSAHQAVAVLVARAEQAGQKLADLPVDAFQAAFPAAGPDVYEHLGPANVVARYAPEGAAGPAQVREQLAFWKKQLGLT